jgi:DNA-binding transcriptional regulator YdaS (Cro superfamily)
MKLSDYLSSQGAGANQNLAATLGVLPAAVSQWRTGSRDVPIEYCLSIERATNGQVTRADLRPHDYWRIWPDLPEPEKVEEGAS